MTEGTDVPEAGATAKKSRPTSDAAARVQERRSQPQPPPNGMRTFVSVLANTMIANITTSFLWFALTFWVYLETRSVLATGIIGGAYMLLIAVFGMLFGTIVDRHRKHAVMVLSSAITLGAFIVAGIVYLLQPESALVDLGGPWFWLFSGVILFGSVVEHMRNIALSTTVTLLVPEERHANANGLVGTVQGLAFITTSVFSGLAIGLLGMGWTLVIAIALTLVALVHLLFVRIPEEKPVAEDGRAPAIDVKGSIAAIRAAPGLFALILFTTLNNLIGGVYIALMDPYGLTLFPVEAWGVVFGIASIGFIIGGIAIAKFGLGRNPIRTMLLVVVVMGILGAFFTIREWWWLYALGIFLYMALIPAVEASGADRHPEGRAVPAAGPCLRLRRGGRVGGRARHGVPHRADRPVLDHPVHGVRRREGGVGLGARRGRCPRHRARLPVQRAAARGARTARLHDAVLPPALGGGSEALGSRFLRRSPGSRNMPPPTRGAERRLRKPYGLAHPRGAHRTA